MRILPSSVAKIIPVEAPQGPLRPLALVPPGVDTAKAKAFQQAAPEVWFKRRRYIAELHEIVYDEEMEDTVAFYDVAVPAPCFNYLVITYRFELVHGHLVACGASQPVTMAMSAYHRRCRKRLV